jgi:hypothetical protein
LIAATCAVDSRLVVKSLVDVVSVRMNVSPVLLKEPVSNEAIMKLAVLLELELNGGLRWTMSEASWATSSPS